MNYEGIDWNEDWVRSMTEDEFVNSSLNRVHWTEAPNIAPPAVRTKRLHELWQLLNPDKNANENDKQPIEGGAKNTDRTDLRSIGGSNEGKSAFP